MSQIAEALSYLHNTEQMLHVNVCPASIIVTKRGMWKLAGLGFVEKTKEGKVMILRTFTKKSFNGIAVFFVLISIVVEFLNNNYLK